MNNGSPALIILACVFTGSLVIAAVISSKIISLGPIVVPAGILAYCLTFVASDVISEIWGKNRARQVVTGGFVALVVCLGLIHLALAWPAAPFWEGRESFEEVLGATPRIILASLAAYLVSQNHDVWAFHFWKKAFQGRHLWLRNNLSTSVSQILDSTIFICIAFWGIMPVMPMILGQILVKLLIALLDTPVVYFLVWLLKKPLAKENPSASG